MINDADDADDADFLGIWSSLIRPQWRDLSEEGSGILRRGGSE
jgi:hypothetical protein